MELSHNAQLIIEKPCDNMTLFCHSETLAEESQGS